MKGEMKGEIREKWASKPNDRLNRPPPRPAFGDTERRPSCLRSRNSL